jgi:hypothetical protein
MTESASLGRISYYRGVEQTYRTKDYLTRSEQDVTYLMTCLPYLDYQIIYYKFQRYKIASSDNRQKW